MMRRNEMSKVAPLSLLAVALLMAPNQAEAAPPSLCTSAPSACTFTGPDAPLLRAEVCWNKVTIKLKTGSVCAPGSWSYWVEHGEIIDPTAGFVIAFAPLPDACFLGLCLEESTYEGPTTAEPLCCNLETEDCSPFEGSCTDEIVFCEQAATNDNGSISCHD